MEKIPIGRQFVTGDNFLFNPIRCAFHFLFPVSDMRHLSLSLRGCCPLLHQGGMSLAHGLWSHSKWLMGLAAVQGFWCSSQDSGEPPASSSFLVSSSLQILSYFSFQTKQQHSFFLVSWIYSYSPCQQVRSMQTKCLSGDGRPSLVRPHVAHCPTHKSPLVAGRGNCGNCSFTASCRLEKE